MTTFLGLISLCALLALAAPEAAAAPAVAPSIGARSRFIGLRDFSAFTRQADSDDADTTDGETRWLSPPLAAGLDWNELVVSWNANLAPGQWLRVEARGIYDAPPERATKFYVMGVWSPDATRAPRHSVNGQRDADGTVQTDTLILKRRGAKLQLRFTLGSAPVTREYSQTPPTQNATAQTTQPQNATAQNATAQNATAQNATAQNATAQNATATNATATNATATNATATNATATNATATNATAPVKLEEVLRFVGLSFLDDAARSTSEAAPDAKRAAWGRILAVPQRFQYDYEKEGGAVWCSPTSTSMILEHWANVLHRRELNRSVPDTARAVHDPTWGGTGNWVFNTAYAGSFSGFHAYVTRFDGLDEVEQWIAAGVPVALSVSYDLLRGKPLKGDGSGHLVVCVGFTPSGDVVINDPGRRLAPGELHRVFPRADVIAGWAHSSNTVYLIYPENAPTPPDALNHWDSAAPRVLGQSKKEEVS